MKSFKLSYTYKDWRGVSTPATIYVVKSNELICSGECPYLRGNKCEIFGEFNPERGFKLHEDCIEKVGLPSKMKNGGRVKHKFIREIEIECDKKYCFDCQYWLHIEGDVDGGWHSCKHFICNLFQKELSICWNTEKPKRCEECLELDKSKKGLIEPKPFTEEQKRRHYKITQSMKFTFELDDFMVDTGISFEEIAETMQVSVEELKEIFAGNKFATKIMAELMRKKYKVLFYADLQD